MTDETTPPPAAAPTPAVAPRPAVTHPPHDPVPEGDFDGPAVNWVWMDDPANVRKLLRFCYVALALLAVIDVVVWGAAHFAHHEPGEHHAALVFWQGWPLGYALYGGIGCAAIILVCKMWFGPLLKRKEGYYD